MRLKLKIEWLKTLGIASEYVREQMRWTADDAFSDVDSSVFSPDELQRLLQLLEKTDGKGVRPARQRVRTMLNLEASPDTVPITRLEALADALERIIGKTEHKWLFELVPDGPVVPVYVVEIVYSPGGKGLGDVATVTVSYASMRRRVTHLSRTRFTAEDIGKTAPEILAERGLYIETPAMVAEYHQTMEVYADISPRTGTQYTAQGSARVFERYYGLSTVAMERDGCPVPVVIDDLNDDDGGAEINERSSSGSAVSSKFWRKKGEVIDEDDVVAVPVQPYVKVFDLKAHAFRLIHVCYLSTYVYDRTLIDKLVLPESRKQLIGMLVEGSSLVMEDIVKGKTGGICVIAAGPAGVGKTLSAEVFSEEVGRPLYVVQCSQLGTNEVKLEEALTTILSRAERWGAILLIDEADVYIHERGDDIQQNAIVGVFLRMLERYRGILFMTTNRNTIVDDAIISRATAVIEYAVPDGDAIRRIWEVLSKNYRADLSAGAIGVLVELFPGISGRAVKNLLKLSTLLALRRKEPVSVDLIRYVSQFVPDAWKHKTDFPVDRLA